MNGKLPGAGFVAFAFLLSAARLQSADQPQFGQAWSRNMVSPEPGLPAQFDSASGKNVRWRADLGTETHSTPVVAGGRVYIGTNNGRPRDPKHEGDRGVLMCLEEAGGRLLWQWVVPKRTEDIYLDWPNSGIASPATVEGDRVYIVNNRGEVACLDALGMANGNDGPFREEGRHMTPAGRTNILTPGPLDADVLWLLDLTEQAGIWSHDAAHSSILIAGEHLYLNTGTGVDNTHRNIRTPQAPSLVVLDKKTGRLLARDPEFLAANIFHSTWAAPSMARVDGQPNLFFAAGNGILYAFDLLAHKPGPPVPPAAASLIKRWEFDFDPEAPKTNVHKYVGNRRESPSDFYGMPVFHKNRIYLTGGGDIWWGKNQAWLKCIRAETGDDPGSRLIWSYALQKHVLSTPAIAEGLVYVADCGGLLHCVDAATGQPVWTHEILGEVWASPLVADGKVFIGTRRGQFYVFAAGREKKLLHTAEPGGPISATATAANQVLYITTMRHLYAIAQPKAAR